MKRKSLAVAAAILAMAALAGPAFAANPTSGNTNPFWYGGQFYGSSYNREEPVAEPGKHNSHPWNAYGNWTDSNQVIPGH